MACCIVPVGLFVQSDVRLNPNPYCFYYRRAFWNKQVSGNVIASNGVMVSLSPAAQQQIRDVYTDGTPLRVMFKVDAKCCGACTMPECDCECKPTFSEPAYATHIYFGERDKEASCPACVAIGFIMCCLGCALRFEKTIFIDASGAGLPMNEYKQLAGPAAQQMQ